MAASGVARAVRDAGVRDGGRVAVAVSGGADSMALAVLAQAAGYEVQALTVDHGLRPESGEEAARVHGWLAQRGIAHRVLPIDWTVAAAPSAMQERARIARYAALVRASEDAGCSALLVAQQADDQVETFLLRLGMGSALDGLAGIRPVVGVPVALPWPSAVRIVRPLLDVPKAALKALLRTEQVPWVEDPSNGKPLYKRNRIRLALAADEALRQPLAALQSFCAAQAEVAYAHANLVHDLVHTNVVSVARERLAYLVHDERWQRAPLPVAARTLKAVTGFVSGGALPPRAAALDAALQRLRRWEPESAPFTLDGCLVTPTLLARGRRAWRVSRQLWPRAAFPSTRWRVCERRLWDDGRYALTAQPLRHGSAALDTEVTVAPYVAVRSTVALDAMPAAVAARLRSLSPSVRATVPLLFGRPAAGSGLGPVLGTGGDAAVPSGDGAWSLTCIPTCTSVAQWLADRGWPAADP